MNKTITKEDLQSWKFVGKSPSGGLCYYDEEEDACAMDYGYYIKVFYSRITGLSGKKPYCFEYNFIISLNLS